MGLEICVSDPVNNVSKTVESPQDDIIYIVFQREPFEMSARGSNITRDGNSICLTDGWEEHDFDIIAAIQQTGSIYERTTRFKEYESITSPNSHPYIELVGKGGVSRYYQVKNETTVPDGAIIGVDQDASLILSPPKKPVDSQFIITIKKILC